MAYPGASSGGDRDDRVRRACSWALAGLVLAASPTDAQHCAGSAADSALLRRLAVERFTVPDDDRGALALKLVDCLSSPDPRLRDDIAFTALSVWLRGRQLQGTEVQALAERLLTRLTEPPDTGGFLRPFAILGLAEVARADRIDSVLAGDRLARLVDEATDHLETLRDYRAYDPTGGWRHGVAHAADLVLQLSIHPRVSETAKLRLLTAIATQVPAHDGHIYSAAEPERLARAVFFAFDRGGLALDVWDRWLAGIGSAAPYEHWGLAILTPDGAARRLNTVSFLHALGLMARVASPAPREALLLLVDRELRRLITV